MNVQQIEKTVAAALGAAGNAATAAAALAPKIPQFIVAADNAVHFIEDAAAKLTGANKKTLVQAMLQAALTELGLAGEFAPVWGALSPVIDILVTLRTLGFIKF